MPEYKAISGLPVASTVDGADRVLIQQGAITKNAAVSLIVQYLEQNSTIRIDDLEDRADNLEAQVSAIETNIDAVETRLDNVESDIVSIDTRVDSVESDIASIETRLDSLESQQNWIDLATQWTSAPIFQSTIASGDVYAYSYGAVTYYRLVPNPYLSTNDVFYGSFLGGILSEPVAARG